MIHTLKDEFEVSVLCAVLCVSRSGYYAWMHRPASAAAARRQRLVDRIRAIHAESDRVYGSVRIHRDLCEQKIAISLNSVAKYMRIAGIRSKMQKKVKVQTTNSDHDRPVFENVLDRDFEADGPNRKWVCDITYIPTEEGFVYLSAVLDCFSRKIVGWSLSDSLERTVCIDALRMAIGNRRRMNGGLTGLLHHSDRGCQYASEDYQTLLEAWEIEVSMSRVGNCWDNAMMESFFGSLKEKGTGAS